MRRIIFCVATFMSLSIFANRLPTHDDRRTVLFAGELQSVDSVPIVVPPSNVSPVTLQYFVPEGSKVKNGDLVLRVDSQGNADIERLELDQVQNRERGLREIADLDVKRIDAEINLLVAHAALAKAKIDAVLPKGQISALDYDKYQAEMERVVRDLLIKQGALENAKASLERKLQDNDFLARRLENQLKFARMQVLQSEVRATRDGIVIHAYDNWQGKRIDEGGRAQIGSVAGQILGDGRLNVAAWVLEADRPFLRIGQELQLRFDAIPNSDARGIIEWIANAPEPRAIWGSGRYFKTLIRLPDQPPYELKQGMSVAVETITSKPVAERMTAKRGLSLSNVLRRRDASDAVATKSLQNLVLDGEVLSREYAVITSPSIRDVWNYNLMMLVAEGSQVKAGEPVAIFEASEVKARLDTYRSAYKERQRNLEKVRLSHIEAAKMNDLTVSETKSHAEKSLRKAALPKELVKRVEYDKLVIERDLFGQLVQLVERQRDALKRARASELRGLSSEIVQLRQIVTNLENGLTKLTVLAPRAGIVLHTIGFDGEKIAVGRRVPMGSAIANLADPEKIFVSAKVLEAQSSLLRKGQPVFVDVPGSSVKVAAKISGFGPIFHGKSANQPIVVRDIDIEFDTPAKNLKPGMVVQVKVPIRQSDDKTAQASTRLSVAR